jgi:O-acetyl-ADP-ribose deacetylase (regulator of RNase III)
VEGSITGIPTDAIITGIYPGSSWTQGVDGAIRSVAGPLFHDQAESATPLYEGEVVIARSKPREAEKLGLKFRHVVFVVDAGVRPLSRLVYAGLKAASGAGFRDVLLPAMRLGVMLGTVEKTEVQVIDQLMEGISRFRQTHPGGLNTATIVIYNNDHAYAILKERFTFE